MNSIQRGDVILDIRDLKADVAGRNIRKGLNLTVRAGEVHAIMGPNGAGKSTLSQILAGRADYDIKGGTAEYLGEDLLALAPEERARRGVFLGFQYPVEIPGVNNVYLLKAALNARRRQQGLQELDAFEFMAIVREKENGTLEQLMVTPVSRTVSSQPSSSRWLRASCQRRGAS